MGGHRSGTLTPDGGAAEASGGSAQVRRVGPVLIAGEAAHAVVEAMKELDKGVLVHDHGSYWRVTSPSGCRLTRAAVEKRLGRPFRLPGDLESVMPSFLGRFKVTEDEASWEAP